jgi:transposase-like protein
MIAEEYARHLEACLGGCPHTRVFPIREKFLHFQCLDCRKTLDVRDAGSLRALHKTFMHAAYLLSRGVQIGPNGKNR